jgi:flagellar biosynthesis/type III secretory pathway M-ring protein FliF/YscJ
MDASIIEVDSPKIHMSKVLQKTNIAYGLAEHTETFLVPIDSVKKYRLILTKYSNSVCTVGW